MNRVPDNRNYMSESRNRILLFLSVRRGGFAMKFASIHDFKKIGERMPLKRLNNS